MSKMNPVVRFEISVEKKKMIFFLILLLQLVISQNAKGNIMSLTEESDTLFKSGYSDVNGIKMYYEIHGNDGEYLVLIHGGGSTIETSFERIIPFLEKNYKVIAMELQGHGHTNDRSSSESFEQDADDVFALLQNLNISKATVMGFSNGGNTAIQIAIRHPEIINKLILASTFYKREGLVPGFFEGMKKATLDVMPELLKEAFLKLNPDSTKLLTMFNKDKERMLQFKNWKDEDIELINIPTLIINGDHDVILCSHAVEMSKLIKNSRLMILPSAHGSYIGVAETPSLDNNIIKLTVEVIKNFID
jgi:pimeloyl-ACP methyl ester carboxylesterase